MQDVITIIQTVGFPIACAVAMFMMLQSEQKAHKEESEKLTQTITEMKISFNDAIHDQESTFNRIGLAKMLDFGTIPSYNNHDKIVSLITEIRNKLTEMEGLI